MEVENFPSFINGIMGPELMDKMRKQAECFEAEFKRGWVTDIDLSKKPYRLQVSRLGEIETESLFLSTGASVKLLNIPGEKENIGRGVSTCATCDGFFFQGKKVIIIGGGDSAMEEANFLTEFSSEVMIVHRREELRASKAMQDRARENSKVSWELNKTPLEVINEGKKVYFHCQGGSNRTGTVAIGTLLALGKANTVVEAEEMAKTERPKISVKPEMKESLQRIFPQA